MFCEKCGAKMEEGTAFCPACGAKVSAPAANQSQPAPTAQSADHAEKMVAADKNKKIGILAVAAAVVVILGILIAVFAGGSGPKSVAKKYMKAMSKGDAEALIDIMPEKMVKAGLEEEGVSRKEMIAEMKQELKQMQRSFEAEFGDDFKYTWDIEEVGSISEDYLDYLKETFKETYGIKLTDVKQVWVDITLEGKYDFETLTHALTVCKVDGKWKVLPTYY